MFKIQTLNNISSFGLERLPKDAYEVGSEMDAPDAYLVRSFKMHDMEFPESALAVGRAGAGTNNIPTDALAQRGVVVFNTPGANANAVKELAIAGMLIAARNIGPGLAYAKSLEGTDDEIGKAVESGKKQFAGFELTGRTLGVIGLGAIGRKVAEAGNALGMKVISSSQQPELPDYIERVATIDELCQRADVISLHVPLNGDTKNLIGADRLALMKPTAMILNFARGGIVDEATVIDMLDAGTLGAYVTDFPGAATKDHPRITAIPHLGASTAEAEDNCAIMAADELRAYLEDGNIINSVNYPGLEVPRNGQPRVCVLSSAEAAAKIAEALPGAHQATKGNVAYTIADGADAKAVEGIEGVYRVRSL